VPHHYRFARDKETQILILQMLQLQASPQAPAGPTLLNYVLLFLPLIAIYYVLVAAPQRKRQKAIQAMIDNLKNGDKVVTSGGVLGTVVRANVDEPSVKIRVAPSVEIDVLRSSITGLQSEPSTGS